VRGKTGDNGLNGGIGGKMKTDEEIKAECEPLGIMFGGRQQTKDGLIPLFTDKLTGTTFMQHADETLEQALKRARKPFGDRG